jgi:putative thioredoxin
MNPMHLGGAPAADPVKDGDISTFAQDVIQASREVPVLVDFWAPWCGPCKQLTPILEKVVRAANGKVRLVKINIDENPELAQQLRIQSVPTVFAFANGQPVTGFAGAQPESQIRQLVERLAGGIGPTPGEDALERARAAAEAGDLQTAASLFQHVLETDKGNPQAIAGFARCLLAAGQLDQARAVLQTTPTEHTNHVEIDGARASLKLAEAAGAVGDPAELERRVAASGDDHAARLELATALFLRGQTEAAIEHLLAIIRRDRGWHDDAARKRLIELFEALGPSHPATVKGRRQLSAVLFS